MARAMVALACGAAALAAHAQGWVVGQVAPLTGVNATHGRAYAEGMRLAFEQANKAGGVQGQAVRLVTLDDTGHPEATVAKTRELLEKSRPVLLAGYFGNRNLTALMDSKLLEQQQIPLIGYQSTDTRVLAAPQIFSTRAGLSEEMGKIATHLSTVGITRLALVYEERTDAPELIRAVTQAVQPAGAQLVASSSVRAGGGVLEKAVQSLQAAQETPQALLVVASSAVTSAFVETYRMGGGTAQIYVNSEADIEQLAKRLPVEFMSGLSIAQVVPSPYKVNMRLNKEFRDVVAEQGKALSMPVGYTMMEGYVNGKVVVEALRRSQPVAREKIAGALRGIDALDLGGYWVGFKPGSQMGSRYVDLSIVNASGRVTH